MEAFKVTNSLILNNKLTNANNVSYQTQGGGVLLRADDIGLMAFFITGT